MWQYHDMVNEVSTVSHLRHPNLVLFLGACTQGDEPLLILNEYAAPPLALIPHSNALLAQIPLLPLAPRVRPSSSTSRLVQCLLE